VPGLRLLDQIWRALGSISVVAFCIYFPRPVRIPLDGAELRGIGGVLGRLCRLPRACRVQIVGLTKRDNSGRATGPVRASVSRLARSAGRRLVRRRAHLVCAGAADVRGRNPRRGAARVVEADGLSTVCPTPETRPPLIARLSTLAQEVDLRSRDDHGCVGPELPLVATAGGGHRADGFRRSAGRVSGERNLGRVVAPRLSRPRDQPPALPPRNGQRAIPR
jgi:hypothetical protein